MQRLNTYLLTHYPLLWNLRIHFVWPVIIILQLLFFLVGYTSVSFPDNINRYILRASSGTYSMAVLLAMLIGVLWLAFYFRNNAFKSFYPLQRGRLAGEGLLILITCFGLTTFIASYEGGAYTHLRSLTAGTDLARETNIANLSHHFLPFSRSNFSSFNDCEYRSDRHEPEYRGDVEDPVMTTTETTAVPAVDTYSYLHYCQSQVSVYDPATVRTPAQNDLIAKRWLHNSEQDSVRTLLQLYLTLCKKYNAPYKFDPDWHTRQIFTTPGFMLRYEISRYSNLDTRDIESRDPIPTLQNAYIEDRRLIEALDAIEEARDGWLDNGVLLLFLYWSLALALAIFSFRLTDVRPWFIALIGAGIWCAVFGVLGSIINYRSTENVMTTIYILLALIFNVSAVYAIKDKKGKRNAGILYLWGLWSLPAVVPIFFVWLQHLTTPNEIYDPVRRATVREPAPFHDWIVHNWPLIGTGNLILFLLLLLLFFIPLARRWQSMPQE